MSSIAMAPSVTELDAAPYSAVWYDYYRKTLGEGVCRQLGIYHIPADLLLSVVIPIYNEEANIPNLFTRLMPVLEGLGRPYELLLSDDGRNGNHQQESGRDDRK